MSDTTHEWQPGQIFIFGSNTAGRHRKGAAETAFRVYGAVEGQSEGRQGQSYAVPTRKWLSPYRLVTLPLSEIASNVTRFLDYARDHAGETFFITALGCGLAGYRGEQIAPLFADAPGNCLLPPSWVAILENQTQEGQAT